VSWSNFTIIILMFQGNTPFTVGSVNVELQKLLKLLSTMINAQLLNTPVITVQLSIVSV